MLLLPTQLSCHVMSCHVMSCQFYQSLEVSMKVINDLVTFPGEDSEFFNAFVCTVISSAALGHCNSWLNHRRQDVLEWCTWKSKSSRDSDVVRELSAKWSTLRSSIAYWYHKIAGKLDLSPLWQTIQSISFMLTILTLQWSQPLQRIVAATLCSHDLYEALVGSLSCLLKTSFLFINAQDILVEITLR